MKFKNRGFTSRCKLLVTLKNRKAKLRAEKATKKQQLAAVKGWKSI